MIYDVMQIVLFPALVLGALAFAAFRLRMFGHGPVGGRSAFVAGGLLLLVTAVWQSVKSTAAFGGWFLPAVADLSYLCHCDGVGRRLFLHSDSDALALGTGRFSSRPVHHSRTDWAVPAVTAGVRSSQGKEPQRRMRS